MEAEPLWYKDAVIYELHVRAFCDGDGDGIGDFKGLTSKLDYLQDLGVTALWLLPFYPSPLKDDGYDISDYTDIHPSYGTLADFKTFLKEAHRRGLKVISELILNHTSDQHPWFQKARRAAPGSSARNFYVWNDSPNKYKETRVIFKDFESSNWTFDQTAQSYFWHRFYSHQPDLNFDNPDVSKATLEVVDFWLKLGVDGMRLDAVPYLYEREGTNCENLTETHQYLKKLRKHVDSKFKNRMFLAEANQWPEDAVTYFGQGDECQMAFHFPIMPRMFMAIHMEDRFPIVDILNQTPVIPETCQWALFLRNHDELTLEMVTDEERDYMYRVYAHDAQARINLGIRRRLAPLLGNHRRKIELMNGLLFSLPGTPVIYYGDELGMGDNMYLGDRNGVRTPMQWSGDRNAGFSQSNPQKLFLPVIIDPEYHYETVNAEAQKSNVHSLSWWMKRLIALRKRFKAFSRGTVEFLAPENKRVLTFIRKHGDERILVVANLSRFVQFVELDLSAYKGMMPVEMFGRIEFPTIGELPYFITMGPHSFYWFLLEAPKVDDKKTPSQTAPERPKICVRENWTEILKGAHKQPFETALTEHIRMRRWFGGKARQIKKGKLIEAVPIPCETGTNYLTMVEIDYAEGESERYMIPVAFAPKARVKSIEDASADSVIAQIIFQSEEKESESGGILFDAFADRDFLKSLLDNIGRKKKLKGTAGEIQMEPASALRTIAGKESLEPSLLKAEQSNTCVIYGDKLILKFFRKFVPGTNPDLEISRYLSETAKFVNAPQLLGSLEYSKLRDKKTTIGILHAFVPSQGNAWSYTLDAISSYFERVIAYSAKSDAKPLCEKTPLELSRMDIDPLANELVNPYLEVARLLGKRTGELHLALAQEKENPSFVPESFSPFYQRSLYQSMRNLSNQVFELLKKRTKFLPEQVREQAKAVSDMEKAVLQRFQLILNKKITCSRIRCHGDFHLGQVLYTGKDFIIIDFEGEPARSLEDRLIKRSPLRDVAGMLRSFHYAAYTSLFGRASRQVIRPEDSAVLESWAHFWYLWSSSAFLKAYFDTTSPSNLLPTDFTELKMLLEIYLLEKSIYELKYELNNRPDWAGVPLKGILQLLSAKV